MPSFSSSRPVSGVSARALAGAWARTEPDSDPLPGHRGDPVGWRDMAACQHVPTELFFPIGHGPAADAQAEVAKSVCGTCPVKVSCLEYALATNVQYGVFGGLTEEERREVRRRVARRHGLELSQLGRLGDLCQLLDLAGLAELGPFAVLGDDDRLEESA